MSGSTLTKFGLIGLNLTELCSALELFVFSLDSLEFVLKNGFLFTDSLTSSPANGFDKSITSWNGLDDSTSSLNGLFEETSSLNGLLESISSLNGLLVSESSWNGLVSGSSNFNVVFLTQSS